MNDVDFDRDFEAHWHDDGGVTLNYQSQTHAFDGRESALRFVRDVARSSPSGRAMRVRTVAGEGPAALLVSPSGNYYDEHHPGIRGSISDVGAFPRRPISSPATAADIVASSPVVTSMPSSPAPVETTFAAGVPTATVGETAAPDGPSDETGEVDDTDEVDDTEQTAETDTVDATEEIDETPEPEVPIVATLREAADAAEGGRMANWRSEPSSLPLNPEPGIGRRRRESFVDDMPPELAPSHGWRGAVAKFGLKIEPSEAERAERVDQDVVSQHWAGPRTIAVVNGKGGAGKTPTTICLSATFAKWGGIGVLAWDNNQTRGTLGWRTERGGHEATTLDLVHHTDRLVGPNAQMADLAHFVHHQRRDRFDVLRSQPLVLAADQRMTPADVEAIHGVASRYYRLIIMDSGNDESDPIWQEMIKHTDQLVVAMTTRDDHAEAGALLLEALEAQGGHAANLAAGSVVVINQADAKATHDDLVRVRNGFSGLAREAVTVRYDAAMVDGALRLANLKPTTQRDWLRATSAIARGL